MWVLRGPRFNINVLQDEKAKKERDRAKWNSLMDEIAKLKTKVPQRSLHVAPILIFIIEQRDGDFFRNQEQGSHLSQAGDGVRLLQVPLP